MDYKIIQILLLGFIVYLIYLIISSPEFADGDFLRLIIFTLLYLTIVMSLYVRYLIRSNRVLSEIAKVVKDKSHEFRECIVELVDFVTRFSRKSIKTILIGSYPNVIRKNEYSIIPADVKVAICDLPG